MLMDAVAIVGFRSQLPMFYCDAHLMKVRGGKCLVHFLTGV